MKYLSVLLIVLLISCGTKSNEQWEIREIPTAEEVGRNALTSHIAPVEAPFATIEFSKASFKDSVRLLKLKANELNHTAINNAIQLLSESGGGTIEIPKGEWKTGRIELKSNVCLHIPEGATLNFSAWVKDYQPAVFTRNEGVEVMSLGACIYATNASNIAITGKGRLIGPTSEEGDIIERIERSSVIENVIAADTPIEERIFDGNQEGGTIFPPMFISPINCTKVYIEGVRLSHTAFWNIVPVYCDDVIIRGVEVNSVGVARGDGIDIESTSNVLIEYCTLSCGDDCFTMKAGRGADGLRVNKPTENVVVRYCLAKEGHGGITCGSETAGWIRNLYVHDCVFDNTGVGIRFKTRRSRAGGGDNLHYERIRMNLKATAFKWDMLGQELYVGVLAKRLPALPVNELTPGYRNIYMKDILVEKCTNFVTVLGIPESPMQNLSMENILVQNANKGVFSAHDLVDAKLKNIKLTVADSIIKLNDVRNLTLSNVEINNIDGNIIRTNIEGKLSDNILIEDCPKVESIKYKKN